MTVNNQVNSKSPSQVQKLIFDNALINVLKILLVLKKENILDSQMLEMKFRCNILTAKIPAKRQLAIRIGEENIVLM